MKKNIFLIAAFAACFACTKEPVEPAADPDVNPDGTITIEAVFDSDEDPDTRTLRLENGKVKWLPGNRLSLFRSSGYNGGSCLETDITGPSIKATFTGPVVSGTGYYYALYPYDPESYYDGTYLVTSLPSVQEGVAGTFADDLFISIGRSKSLSMPFYHLCGGVKFSVTEENIRKVTLVANGGEMLAGKLGIGYSSSRPVVKAYENPVSVLEMVPEDGEFEVEEAYHFVTVPTTLANGFSLVFERADGCIAVKTISKSVTIQRAHFATLLEADKDLEWEKNTVEYSPDELELDPVGGSFSLQIRATGDYHVEVDPDCDWIIPTGVVVKGHPAVGVTHSFQVLRNKGEERMTLISVCNSSNCFPVMVTQGDGNGLKDIVHHSLGMRFTATWCGWCPYMNESFYKAQATLGSRYNIVNFHATNSSLPFSDTPSLLSQYKIGGYPTGIVDGRMEIDNNTNTDAGAQDVIRVVEETENNYIAMTAVGLYSSVSGRSVSVEADVYAMRPDEYKLTVILLENGIVKAQTYYTNNGTTSETLSNYVHDNTARMTVSSSVLGDSFTTTSVGETYHFTFPAVKVPDGYEIANMTVLGYVQRKFAADEPLLRSANYGDFFIDNSRIVPVGTSAAPEAY